MASPRLTVNLPVRHQGLLDQLVADREENITQVVLRAISAYAYLNAVEARGARFTVTEADGSEQLVKLL
jgi:hypothetical protein